MKKDIIKKKNSSKDDEANIRSVGVSLSANEIVGRFGSANAEFLKGYSGVDNESGQKFAKGLDAISKHKLNEDPAEAIKNIKQQAGFSAEVAATSRDNADAIINGSDVRTIRSDDLLQFGKNHNVVDRVKILDGQIIEGSQAQMKFVGNRDHLFERVASEDGKFSRYRGVKLELPSEQFEGAQEFCTNKAQELRNQADQPGLGSKPEIAAKLRREADNYDQLAKNLQDSGLTTEDAIFYRKHPKIATALDIGRTSHYAGMEGAKVGAAVGSVISLMQNIFAVAQERKSLGDATIDLAADTTKAAALGYGVAFTGSAIKGVMQQSGNQTMRQLANTNAPALVLGITLSLSGSIKRYVQGDISEAQLLAEVGEQGAGMLSSGMMAALGQIAIPVPFVGAAIGGMIGYTLSTMFYQAALDVGARADGAWEELARVRELEGAARERIARERASLDAFMRTELPELEKETRQLFSIIESHEDQGVDIFSIAINSYAELLGAQLEFKSLTEFDAFMATDKPLRL